jgi:hypothetical protein
LRRIARRSLDRAARIELHELDDARRIDAVERRDALGRVERNGTDVVAARIGGDVIGPLRDTGGESSAREGTVPGTITAAAFAARVKDELATWKQIATERRIVAE